MKIAIIGGHITPALAVIEELQKNEKNKITYFGRRYSFEGDNTFSNDFEVISKIKGLKYVDLETGRLQRQWSRYTISSLFKIPRGFWQAYQELKRNPVDVILSFGGYLAFPVTLAGSFLKIPIVIHEQTVTVGLSNKLISLLAQKILVSWPQSLPYFPAHKTVLEGNPIRKEIIKNFKFQISNFKLKKIIEDKINDPKRKLIYITGGNQGARVINEAIWQVLSLLLPDYYIIHQCGIKDWERLQNKQVSINIPEKQKEKYYLAPWMNTEEVAAVMNWADFVISRAGANTVYELAAIGKPAVFIPIPWVVNNEQQKNAQILSDFGMARILSQNDLKPSKIKKVITEMYDNLPKYREKGQEFKKQIILNAAEKIREELEAIVRNVKSKSKKKRS